MNGTVVQNDGAKIEKGKNAGKNNFKRLKFRDEKVNDSLVHFLNG